MMDTFEFVTTCREELDKWTRKAVETEPSSAEGKSMKLSFEVSHMGLDEDGDSSWLVAVEKTEKG